jgi:hypothetical protein
MILVTPHPRRMPDNSPSVFHPSQLQQILTLMAYGILPLNFLTLRRSATSLSGLSLAGNRIK